MNLSTNLAEAEAQIREVLRVAISEIDEVGTIQTRDRPGNSLAEHMKILPYVHPTLGTTTARGALIKFKGPDSELDDPGETIPPRLSWHIEFIMQYEDMRRDGTNSDEDFTRILMEFFTKITNDRRQGYDDLYLEGPFKLNNAAVRRLDNKDLIHSVIYSIECVYEDS